MELVVMASLVMEQAQPQEIMVLVAAEQELILVRAILAAQDVVVLSKFNSGVI
jgi:hypothetical protein